MILQNCPKCGSSRIRRGYKRTPLLLRLFGIYHLLCDHCNLLFVGFAVPGTVRHNHRKKMQIQNQTPTNPGVPTSPSTDLS